MKKPASWFSVLAYCTVFVSTTTATATSQDLEPRYVERKLVLPQATLRIDGGPKWPFPTFRLGQLSLTHVENSDTFLHLNAGLTAGIVENLEVGFLFPIQFVPDADLHNPILHAQYQFVRGPLDASFLLAINLPFEGEFLLWTGIPLRGHLGGVVSLDTGAFIQANPGDSADLVLPLEIGIQIADSAFLGPETALVLAGFEHVAVPIGFMAGYTIRSADGTLGDLHGRFRVLDVTNDLTVWQLLFGFDVFFDL